MKRNVIIRRLAAMALALILAASLAPAAFAAGTDSSGMGNFKKTRAYPGFPDVEEDAWYYADVRSAYELGLINGRDGSFDPQGKLSLAEAVTMAVNVCAVYSGDAFTPGGSPWYANAVRYAERAGIIFQEEYKDFDAPASRADVARMFASCIDGGDLKRINRVAWIPDVTPETSSWSCVYALYNAGVLAGDTSGRFRPGETITRAEAAAVLNRVADPGKRLSFSMTASAPGKVTASGNGSFQLSIPEGQGWELAKNIVDESGSCRMYVRQENQSATLQIDAYSKSRYPNMTAASSAGEDETFMREDFGGTVSGDGVYASWTRGLYGFSFDYAYEADSGDKVNGRYSCMENSKYVITVWMDWDEGCPEDVYRHLQELLMSLDLAM